MSLFSRVQEGWQGYPRQFWLIMAGMLFSTIGTSMVWPFLTIYVSEQLAISLTEVTALITLNGLVSLGASILAGPAADRVGRKRLMVISLAGNGLTYLAFSQAGSYAAFAMLMGLRGLFPALFKVATNAMITDLVPPERRPDAFAQMRLWHNLGIAFGPAIGGFVVSRSYQTSFVLAAIGLTTYALAIALFARETKPGQAATLTPGVRIPLGGYGALLRDSRFVAFISHHWKAKPEE